MDISGRLRRLGGRAGGVDRLHRHRARGDPRLLSWGHKWWFWADDWDFLGTRTGGNLSDLFRAHYQHWVTLPILAYRLLWWVFGIRTYVPYQLLIITLHLATALLLRTVMRRAGVRPWFATLTAGVFVFFGSGAENIVVAFQITFVGALMFGLVQLLLADHNGSVNWFRRTLALVAGLAALMCSGVGIAMVVIVGIAMLLRRGWRIALLQTVPLLVAFGLWSRLSPKGPGAGSYKSQSPVQVVKFMWTGAGATLGRLAQVPGLAILLTLVALVGLGVAIRARRIRCVPRDASRSRSRCWPAPVCSCSSPGSCGRVQLRVRSGPGPIGPVRAATCTSSPRCCSRRWASPPTRSPGGGAC